MRFSYVSFSPQHKTLRVPLVTVLAAKSQVRWQAFLVQRIKRTPGPTSGSEERAPSGSTAACGTKQSASQRSAAFGEPPSTNRRPVGAPHRAEMTLFDPWGTKRAHLLPSAVLVTADAHGHGPATLPEASPGSRGLPRTPSNLQALSPQQNAATPPTPARPAAPPPPRGRRTPRRPRGLPDVSSAPGPPQGRSPTASAGRGLAGRGSEREPRGAAPHRSRPPLTHTLGRGGAGPGPARPPRPPPPRSREWARNTQRAQRPPHKAITSSPRAASRPFPPHLTRRAAALPRRRSRGRQSPSAPPRFFLAPPSLSDGAARSDDATGARPRK